MLSRGETLDQAFDAAASEMHGLDGRDLALARMIAGSAMRRRGTLEAVLGGLMERGLPKKAGPLGAILLTAAAQIAVLDVPDHAAVDLAIRLARADSRAQAFSGLANAVLRRFSVEKAVRLAAVPLGADAPAWLLARWRQAYGDAATDAILAAHRSEPALDLTVQADSNLWAERLGARRLPTGSLRLVASGPVAALPGFAEGDWWVQDAAAALPARLLGDVSGLRVADLCAAPGGKTAQLAAAGARVTAVDRSGPRLARLSGNLARLGLSAEVVEADATAFAADPFDAVLLDAPCSATGTIRRHPDVAWTKSAADVTALAGLQSRLLDHAAVLVRRGGLLVYCTCSLEPEEGEGQIGAFLARTPGFVRVPIRPGEVAVEGAVTAAGELRTLPGLWPDPDPRMAGLDGFFAARLQRAG